METTAFGVNETNRLCGIVVPLLSWYDENARVLPWRENTEPYRVWVSETMLQQTQVETVIPYYNRFMRQIPDIQSLAETGQEKLFKLWEGLGYYTRARNLKKAAQTIMAKYNGRFPEAYGDILSLPGIGKYTAGAIASICFGQPVPAVDGNVLRVAARLTGYDADISAPEVKDKVTGLLCGIYPKTRSGDFTQSLMELGATVCLPKGSPKCGNCPVAFLCRAYQTGSQMSIPVKAKKRPRKKERKTVFLLHCGDKIAVRQRETNTLLGGLWEFPNAVGDMTIKQAGHMLAQWGISVATMAEGAHKKHVFTHVEWEMASYIVICENMTAEFLWVTKDELTREMTLPSAFQGFFSVV
ncbi:MAG: A/G-specific adenine glycosylase [Oscillospiraceae bacterium]